MQDEKVKKSERFSRKCERCIDLEILYKQVGDLQWREVFCASPEIKVQAEQLREIGISMINKWENEKCVCSAQLFVDFPV